MHAGIVTAIGTDPAGAGDFVTIDHSWGQSTYTNVEFISVIAGEQVDRTLPIGASGPAGLRPSPHLGLGIRIKPIATDNGWDGYTDPLPYLPPSSYILPTYITQPSQP
ncbi:MAG: peptidoglycan DD-metalloendopeptidase family protein [Anaerolineales bacterium]|nr:peptidoglycan DD-metalloendopeptidase family protein [Anaerolineales bacterium]